jgi:hypothetical protein
VLPLRKMKFGAGAARPTSTSTTVTAPTGG